MSDTAVWPATGTAVGACTIYPVILCGGTGTQLWPLSRSARPKQLLPLLSSRTMLQETVARTAFEADFAPPMLVCGEEHRFDVLDQLDQIGVRAGRVVVEPVGRNTAPALAVAALILAESDPDAILLVQPADHHIPDAEAFRAAVRRGAAAAAGGCLVTFGVRPTRPETGYGYIRAGAPLAGADGACAVEAFVEKPDRDTAARLLADGHLWNSGIFLLPVARLLDELARLTPALLEACRGALAPGAGDAVIRLDPDSFARAPDISIDYAVMEQARDLAVVPVEFAWNDIGSWPALGAFGVADASGNVTEGDVVLEDARGCYVRTDGQLVVACDVENLVVVSTRDAVLVAGADRGADLSRVIQRLKGEGRSEPLHHRRVHRPWGYYETVDAGERYQVKRIMVKPGAQLSLQKHHHRSEHWVVVAGTAVVTRDDETRLLGENQSIFIPLGARHRLENPGKVPLHLIEVQSGCYLGEDDIVRLEDSYGRA